MKPELIRIHSLVNAFTLTNQTIAKQAGQSNTDRSEQLADKQIQLLDLLGSSLIYEENFLLGFLPLRSYFATRKQTDLIGKKCPADKEDQIRCLIIKEALEMLGCVEAVTNLAEETKIEEDASKVEDFFAQIDSQDITREPSKKLSKPLIVLDV